MEKICASLFTIKSSYHSLDCIECLVRDHVCTCVDTHYLPIYNLSIRIDMDN